jgi:hypothetical protein
MSIQKGQGHVTMACSRKQETWISDRADYCTDSASKNKQVPTRCYSASSLSSANLHLSDMRIRISSKDPDHRFAGNRPVPFGSEANSMRRHSHESPLVPLNHSHAPQGPGSQHRDMRFVQKAMCAVAGEGQTGNRLQVSHLP